jgi:hypothetical protein
VRGPRFTDLTRCCDSRRGEQARSLGDEDLKISIPELRLILRKEFLLRDMRMLDKRLMEEGL